MTINTLTINTDINDLILNNILSNTRNFQVNEMLFSEENEALFRVEKFLKGIV